MYKQYLISKPSKIGTGTFTKVDIKANMPIMEISGELHTKETMPQPHHPAWLQISNQWFIGPSGSVDDYINHSCEPNCYMHIVGKRAFLYSLHFIPAGTELTFDYSTTCTSSPDDWAMKCLCGTFKCRKYITGFDFLPETLKNEYIKKGMVPMFIIDPRFKGE